MIRLDTTLRGAAGAALLLGAATAMAGELNLYSARHYDSDQRIYEAFEAKTGIAVRALQGNSDGLLARLRVEGDATPADVLLTVDAGRLWRAEEARIFAPTESNVLTARLPAAVRHPEGLWFGFSKRMRIVYYDKARYPTPPLSTYEELADPRFDGQLCIRSSNNIYNQSLLASMVAEHGEQKAREWAAGLVSNMARPPQGGDTDQIRAVAAGECGIGVGNHYYYVRLLKSDDAQDRAAADRVGLVFPNQEGRGTHVNVGGAGRIAAGPNPENAKRFLEFLASAEAQRLFAAGNYEWPAVESGIAIDPVLESWGPIKTDDLNVSLLGRNNPVAVRIMDLVGWR